MADELKHKMLGSLLKERGLITDSQLEAALEEGSRTGKLLGRVLVDMGFVTEAEILKTLGTQSGMDVIDLNQVEISDEVIQKVSPSIAGRLHSRHLLILHKDQKAEHSLNLTVLRQPAHALKSTAKIAGLSCGRLSCLTSLIL